MSGADTEGEAASPRWADVGGAAGTRTGEGRRPTDRPFTIGLTGPIGCGKSTVAGMLAELGAVVIDADRLAHDATAPGESTLRAIRDRFGEAVFHNSELLDRAALAAIVFADSAALRDLEAIVHPAVRHRLVAEVEQARLGDAPFVVVEAIKLVEGGYAAECDEVWLVGCDADRQRERLLARGLPPEDVARRMAAQGADLVERLDTELTAWPGATVARRLSTDGDLAATRTQVEDALAEALDPIPWISGPAPGR